MEPKHKRRSFGLYEIALLKENPYTHEVRARQISFTAEFKRIFWARYQAGEYIAGRRDRAEALMMDKPDKKFELIREVVSKEDNVLSITELCRLAGVSRSGYYRWVNAEDVRNE